MDSVSSTNVRPMQNVSNVSFKGNEETKNATPPEQKKDGNDKLKKTLIGLGIAGAAIAGGIFIKHKIDGKKATDAVQKLTSNARSSSDIQSLTGKKADDVGTLTDLIADADKQKERAEKIITNAGTQMREADTLKKGFDGVIKDGKLPITEGKVVVEGFEDVTEKIITDEAKRKGLHIVKDKAGHTALFSNGELKTIKTGSGDNVTKYIFSGDNTTILEKYSHTKVDDNEIRKCARHICGDTVSLGAELKDSAGAVERAKETFKFSDSNFGVKTKLSQYTANIFDKDGKTTDKLSYKFNQTNNKIGEIEKTYVKDGAKEVATYSGEKGKNLAVKTTPKEGSEKTTNYQLTDQNGKNEYIETKS